MKIVEIKAELKRLGVKGITGKTKPELMAMLTKADKTVVVKKKAPKKDRKDMTMYEIMCELKKLGITGTSGLDRNELLTLLESKGDYRPFKVKKPKVKTSSYVPYKPKK